MGAVNCHEDRHTCFNMGIQSFPSLILFLKREVWVAYHGPRDVDSMRSFVLKHFGEVPHIHPASVRPLFAALAQPALVIVCVPEDSDCPSRDDLKMVGGSLSCTHTHAHTHTHTHTL